MPAVKPSPLYGRLLYFAHAIYPARAGQESRLHVVALFAGYLPARRASRIDPMAAVRME